jgi:hypothetical protein
MVSVWCNGPGIPWDKLTKIERLAILFRPSSQKDFESDTHVLESVASKFGVCGVQLVELDLSIPDDIYPMMCPVCKTDTNWDIEGFVKTYPQYRSPT